MRAPSALTVSIIVAATASLMLASCTSRGNSTPDPRLDGQWRLSSASDSQGSLVLGDTVVTLNIGDVRHSGGQSPCTEYTATVTGSAGVVFVRASSAGRGDCPDPQLGDLEDRYLAALNDTDFAAVRDTTLVLSSARGSLHFVRGVEPKAAALEGTTWVLESLSPAATLGITQRRPSEVSVRFDGENNLLVSGACSTISAVYSSADRRVSVTSLRTDSGDGGICANSDATTAQQIIHLLGGAFTLDIHGGTLFVTSIDTGENAVFRAREG